jgi:hypothetical protein
VFCGDLCESVRTIVAITIFNDEVSILHQSTLSQPHDKCRDGALFYRQHPWNRSVEITDSEELPWLLRAHSNRRMRRYPRRHRQGTFYISVELGRPCSPEIPAERAAAGSRSASDRHERCAHSRTTV